MKKIFLFTIIFAAVLSCGFAKAKKTDKTSIAVFVPGIIDDSPVYNMLVQGVKAAVEEKNQNLSKKEKIDLFAIEATKINSFWTNGNRSDQFADTGMFGVRYSNPVADSG